MSRLREKYIKLNSNENPFPPTPRVKEILREYAYEDLRFYPDPMSLELREKLGTLYGFSPGQIICGNTHRRYNFLRQIRLLASCVGTISVPSGGM
jgi:histidinol-phosphate aminotransferase